MNAEGTILYCIRHGETEENAHGLFQGHRPGKLSAKGKQQAETVRKELEGISFYKIISSDLQRVLDTVEIINREMHLIVEKSSLLRERYMGLLTEKSVETINEPGARVTVEKDEVMAVRCRMFLQYVKSEYAGKTLLIASHGHLLQVMESVIRGISVEEVEEMTNCKIRRFKV